MKTDFLYIYVFVIDWMMMLTICNTLISLVGRLQFFFLSFLNEDGIYGKGIYIGIKNC